MRVVPGASARWGSFLGRGVICMPSYVNIGARVGAGTMVDTWATVGSCAQIGERVHLSGGVGIGGVLEPPQAAPVVIEDDVMVGSRCMITQGARVGPGPVLGEGTILNPAIPVIDAETGEELSRGHVPPWCVAVQASRRRDFPGGEFFLPCVLVIKRLTEGQRHDKAAAERHPAPARRLHVNAGDTRGPAGPDRRAGGHPLGQPPRGGRWPTPWRRPCARCPWLEVERVGANVVARTELGRASRVLLAGHLDTVPPVGGNEEPRLEGDTLYGLGAADMKGGLAVLLHLAAVLSEPAVDVT